MTNIDTITRTLREQQEAALAAYRSLVIGIGEGSSKVDPADIMTIIRNAGMTIEQHDADARRAKRRSEDRATIAKAPEAKKKIDDARKAIEAADAVLEQAKQDRHAKVRPLSAAISEGQEQLNEVTAAKAALRESMWPEDKDTLAHLDRRVQACHKAWTEATSRLAAVRSRNEPDREQLRANYGWVKNDSEPMKLSVSGKRLQDAEQAVSDAKVALDAAIDKRDAFTTEALAR